MKKIILTTIEHYQKASEAGWRMGPLFFLPSECRFYPTCSHYMAEAVDRYGVTRGVVKGLGRFLRCNPFTQPGVDLP